MKKIKEWFKVQTCTKKGVDLLVGFIIGAWVLTLAIVGVVLTQVIVPLDLYVLSYLIIIVAFIGIGAVGFTGIVLWGENFYDRNKVVAEFKTRYTSGWNDAMVNVSWYVAQYEKLQPAQKKVMTLIDYLNIELQEKLENINARL